MDEERQTGNTKNMIFNFNYLISHISKYLTLKPGCVISTGTPAGTGMEQTTQKISSSWRQAAFKS